MKRKDILILLIPMFIIVILWVIFSIYHNFVNSTIPESLNMQILSISPNFDLKTIESIKQREVVEPVYSTSANPQTAIQESTSAGELATAGGKLR